LALFACRTPESYAPAEVSMTVGPEEDFPSLREALETAPPEVNVLILGEGVYGESGLTVDRDIVIRGAGMDRTFVRGAPASGDAPDRIFLVENRCTVRFEGLTVENGVARDTPRRGGGILNFGELHMDRCRVRGNTAVYGVGLDNRGTALISNCEFVDNMSVPLTPEERMSGVGCTGSGGAIKNEPGGLLSVHHTLFDGNSAQTRAGALYVSCESRATVYNCSMRNNVCGEAGGAVYVRGELVLTNCRIAENTSGEGAGGVHVRGYLDFTGNVIRGNSRADLIVGTGTAGIHGDGIIGIDRNNRIGVQRDERPIRLPVMRSIK
jgi:hypothetical protein